MTWESLTVSEITLTQTSVLEMATNVYEQPTFELKKNRAVIRVKSLADIRSMKSSENKVIPLSYQIFLQSSIGNHDEYFLKGYHDMLAGFSSQVMEYTAKYCKEKILPISKHKGRIQYHFQLKLRKHSPQSRQNASKHEVPLKLIYTKGNTTIHQRYHDSNTLQKRPSQQRLSRRSSGRNINHGNQQGRLTRRNSY